MNLYVILYPQIHVTDHIQLYEVHGDYDTAHDDTDIYVSKTLVPLLYEMIVNNVVVVIFDGIEINAMRTPKIHVVIALTLVTNEFFLKQIQISDELYGHVE